MPTYRDIAITLQSQYDARTIPEYPLSTSSPTSTELHAGDSICCLPASNIAEVYVSNYARSQLWIEYSCPFPSELSKTKYYYFKLFVKEHCLLSWGVGEQDSWAGKVTWGIYHGGSDFEGRSLLEKRAFFFPSDNDVQREEHGFEIKVFRAKARKREHFSAERLRSKIDADVPTGPTTRNAGQVTNGEPRSMYTYALIDALDEPHATFRWNCRTTKQLRALGFKLEGEDDISEVASHMTRRSVSPENSPQPSPPAPDIPKDNMSRARRLSFPPRLQFAPTKQRSDPGSPVKKGARDGENLDLLEGLNLADEQPSSDVGVGPVAAASMNGGAEGTQTTETPVERSFSGPIGWLRRRANSRDERKAS